MRFFLKYVIKTLLAFTRKLVLIGLIVFLSKLGILSMSTFSHTMYLLEFHISIVCYEMVLQLI